MQSATRPNPFLTRYHGWTGEGGGVSARDTKRTPANKSPESVSFRPSPEAALASSASTGLGYKLIRLKPHPSLLSTSASAPRSSAIQHPHTRASLTRWVLVYVPVMCMVAAVLYVLCELAFKLLALWNFRRQVVNLPDAPPSLPAAFGRGSNRSMTQNDPPQQQAPLMHRTPPVVTSPALNMCMAPDMDDASLISSLSQRGGL